MMSYGRPAACTPGSSRRNRGLAVGWFDSQIKERERAEAARMAEAVSGLAEALTGVGGAAAQGRASVDAVTDILSYLGARPQMAAGSSTELTDVIEELVRPQGIMYREVALTPGWSREASGPMLGWLADGTPVALLPQGSHGYAYRDHASGRAVRVGAKDAEGLAPRALLFYRALPSRVLRKRDIYLFMLRSVTTRDWLTLLAAAAAVTVLGLVLPVVNEFIFDPLLSLGGAGARLLAPIFALLLSISLAQVVIGSVRTLVMARIETSVSVSLTAALMMRVLQLPATFFKRHAAGDLSSRVLSQPNMVKLLSQSILSIGLSMLFSLIYLVQIISLTPALALPALLATLASLVACALVAYQQTFKTAGKLAWSVRRSGWEFGLINGIQKIRLAGAETRAFSTWADIYKNEVHITYGEYLDNVVLTGVSLVGTLVIYVCAAASGVSSASFMAFASAYGMVTAALALLAEAASEGIAAGPYLDLIEPILSTEPETQERRHAVGKLAGGIELDHVTFSYAEDMPPVLNDLSLKIRPGQYVGIVGRTGCGKSTLMRLLLGFEEPRTGAVYYDGRDLTSLDVRSLRRNIGVVLQDGKLFGGDIYSNIVVSAPWLTLDDAWRAAELAGIADDIRAMPMGMNTVIGEGMGGISGGQRQRIMIARAIAASPSILMFDEATSALDNVTQAEVSASLESLKCTRIAIAHRLSTVRHCDRILVLDGGRIVEDGTYDELMALDGVFTELVRRQQV